MKSGLSLIRRHSGPPRREEPRASLWPSWFQGPRRSLTDAQRALLLAEQRLPSLWSFRDVDWGTAQGLAEAVRGTPIAEQSEKDPRMARQLWELAVASEIAEPVVQLLQLPKRQILPAQTRQMLVYLAGTPFARVGPLYWPESPNVPRCQALKQGPEIARCGTPEGQVWLIEQCLKMARSIVELP